MDEKDREQLQAELVELDRAEESLRAARKPFDDGIVAIETVRCNLLEKHDVEIAGNCDGCARLLFCDEQGYRHDDGVLCSECAPTWADAAKNWSDNDDPLDADTKGEFFEALESHLSAGGSKDDKLPLHSL